VKELEVARLALPDGARTTVYVLRLPRERWRGRVVRMRPLRRLREWCRSNGVDNAIIGGFFLRPFDRPLGEIWVDGERLPSEPWPAPWDEERSCVHFDGGSVRLRPRAELPASIRGDLLQAGPLLVRDGRVLIEPGRDPEGFSAGCDLFDSDITIGRYPRAAIGVNDRELIAFACDGRCDADAGMTLGELAAAMRDAGARDALNLDGGGSTSLIAGGELVNVPRKRQDLEIPGGRTIPTALAFEPR